MAKTFEAVITFQVATRGAKMSDVVELLADVLRLEVDDVDGRNEKVQIQSVAIDWATLKRVEKKDG